MTTVPPDTRISDQVRAARAAFESGRTRPLRWRAEQLDALVAMVTTERARIEEAVHADLSRSGPEAYVSEVSPVRREAATARRNLRRWTRDRPVFAPPTRVGTARAWVRLEPLGTVLIISPWNFPFRLTLMPLVGALAAGDSVVLKPSELSVASTELLAEILPRYLDPDAVQVVTGGVDAATELLTHRFDHILYTGNGRVGSIVMTAAARHLTPVTLELGGKCPVWVDETVDLERAARSIAWGKFANAGQACAAPDHVLTTPALAPRLAEALAATVTRMYGDEPALSPDFARIVDQRHTRRLAGLLGSGTLLLGGQVDVDARYVAPTVLLDPDPDSPVMTEEIFGPILPVVAVPDVAAAITRINARGKPLALYAFTRDAEARRALTERTGSGALVFDTVMAHVNLSALPFGGVGDSGLGAYHGQRSVRVFSHERAMLARLPGIDLPDIASPPLRGFRGRLLRWF